MFDQKIHLRPLGRARRFGPPNKAVLNFKKNTWWWFVAVGSFTAMVSWGLAMIDVSSHGFARAWGYPSIYIAAVTLLFIALGFWWGMTVPKLYDLWYNDIVSGRIIERKFVQTSRESCKFIAVVVGRNLADEIVTRELAVSYVLWQELKEGQSYPWPN